MKFITYNKQKISKLSLGTVQFGLNYGISNNTGQPSQETVNDIVNYVWKEEINCFDTAQAYGNAENVLGKAIQNKKNPLLISKIKTELFLNNVLEHVNNSLNNLKTNELFGLLLHDTKLLYNWQALYSKSIKELKDKNKIKYFGVSIYTDDEFNKAIDNDNINFIQIPFNIFDQRAISKSWFTKAKAKNKLIFIRSIFLQGLLLMEEKSIPNNLNNVRPYLKTLSNLANKYSLSKQEMALSFVNTLAYDSLILFGCENISQAKENIDIFNNIKHLDKDCIIELKNAFSKIDDSIYNPSKW